jgi:hypothetical protein
VGDCTGLGHLQRRSLIEPRWNNKLPSANDVSGEPVGEGTQRVITDSNKIASSYRKFSDSNNVGSSVMEVSDEGSDSRTGVFKIPSQPKLLIQAKMSVQDIQRNAADIQPSSGSPTPFQSLEVAGSQVSSSTHLHQSMGDHFSHLNVQVLHPSISNLSFGGGLGVENRSVFPGK